MVLGLGAYASDFLQGTRDESQRMRGERRKLAEAFQQFKTQNPEAGYGDFRQFVDSMGGSDSYYLMGAVPGDDVLKELGNQNEINRQTSLMRKQTDQMLMNLQGKDAQRQLINEARRQNISPDKLPDYLIGQLGIKDPNQQADLRQRLAQMDLPNVYTQLGAEEIEGILDKTLPRINSGLFATEDQLDSVIPEYLLPTEQGQALKKQLGTGLNQFLSGKRRQLMTEGLSMALELGPALSPKSVETIVTDIYGTELPPETLRDLAETLFKRAEEERTNAKTDRTRRIDTEDRTRAKMFYDRIAGDPEIERAVRFNSQASALEVLEQHVRDEFGSSWTEEQVTARALQLYRKLDGVFSARQSERYETSMREMPQVVQKEMESVRSSVGRIVTAKKAGGETKAAFQVMMLDHWINPNAVSSMVDTAKQMEAEGATADDIVNALKQSNPRDIMSVQDRSAALAESMGGAKPQRREEYVQAARSDYQKGLADMRKELLALRAVQNPLERRQRLQAWSNQLMQLQQGFKEAVTGAAQNQQWALVDSTMNEAAFRREIGGMLTDFGGQIKILADIWGDINRDTPAVEAIPKNYSSPAMGRPAYMGGG